MSVLWELFKICKRCYEIKCIVFKIIFDFLLSLIFIKLLSLAYFFTVF